jgi:hypothetical protein
MSQKVINLGNIMPAWVEETTINGHVYKIGDKLQLPDFSNLGDYGKHYIRYNNRKVIINQIENKDNHMYYDSKFGECFTFAMDSDDPERTTFTSAELYCPFKEALLIRKTLASFIVKQNK